MSKSRSSEPNVIEKEYDLSKDTIEKEISANPNFIGYSLIGVFENDDGEKYYRIGYSSFDLTHLLGVIEVFKNQVYELVCKSEKFDKEELLKYENELEENLDFKEDIEELEEKYGKKSLTSKKKKCILH